MFRRLMLLGASVGAMLASILVLTASAAAGPPPLGVNFVVHTVFADQGGPFTATGFAVDYGLVCAAGHTELISSTQTSLKSFAGTNYHVVYQFVCDDQSGTFDVKLSVRIDHKGDNFNWTIIGGTDAYAALHGSGQGYGVQTTQAFVDDYYYGAIK